jgi:hypothetical protein
MEREENRSQAVDTERQAGLESVGDTSGDADATPVTGDPGDVSQVDSAGEGFADGAE